MTKIVETTNVAASCLPNGEMLQCVWRCSRFLFRRSTGNDVMGHYFHQYPTQRLQCVWHCSQFLFRRSTGNDVMGHYFHHYPTQPHSFVLRLSLTIPNLVWFAPIFFPDLCSQPRIAVVKVATIMNLCEHV